MTPKQNTRAFRIDLLLAGALVAIGLTISSTAFWRQSDTGPSQQMAQATPQPLQSTPGAKDKPVAPDETINHGPRPHQIAPQPARPDPAAIDAGAKPALPRAPAEKIGEPIRAK
ncbi:MULTISPECIES: hypothetical protein [Rhodopseudomonas]|uniref:Uncharacterized protein n=1 Tax=Rhodopseudomonas palustris TaxID=1076 RepID=A0A0D7DXX0_RHOPL|nr:MULTISPECIES: hypothetical protein [Rhodopseudomonas]KIZ33116.1 hypothetical protein OO17_28885 [Rhodopseudomonas palustris]MDF3814409.1 hypothetical protein [Rhodopseudomonas sp. BAL398]WOK17105.1 hypothetical protein RBJ75_23745 [Rhodopseudomonas sp. BAL398]